MNSGAVVMPAGGGERSCGSKSCACKAGGAKSPGYLAALTLLSWGIQVPMLLLAVPKFAERFSDFGVQLPVVSRLVIDWSRWMGTGVFGTEITGAVVYGLAIGLLAIVCFGLAKVGGRAGKALVVVIALLGGAIACGQAAAVIVPAVRAQQALDAAPASAPAP